MRDQPGDIDGLLVAAGGGDQSAYAAFYDRTAPTVLQMLCAALDQVAAERAALRVYLRVWRTAPSFNPRSGRSASDVLMSAALRERAIQTIGRTEPRS